jgi:hypothetical protein
MSNCEWDLRSKEFKRYLRFDLPGTGKFVENHTKLGTRQDAYARGVLIGKKGQGGLIYDLRTFLRHNSIAHQIHRLLSVT